MTRSGARMAVLGLILAGLAGCGGDDDRTLVERLDASSAQAPDEFSILPQKPLELPEDLTTLPQPQPGSVNRTDLTPQADALRALGGGDTRGTAVASDRALLAATGAGGRQPGIRAVLAEEDAQYRRENRGAILYRLFRRSTESVVYDDEILDAEAELLRLRAMGIWVPQLPPAE